MNRLAGHTIDRAALVLTSSGRWQAMVRVLADEKLEPGLATLELGGESYRGSILAPDPTYGSTGWYRVVGGAGWDTVIDGRAYRAQIGIGVDEIARDAAAACGETLAGGAPTTSVGTSFVYPACKAARVLDLVAPSAWYVDVDGETHLGAWPSSTYEREHTVIDRQPGRKAITIAALDLRGLVPGAVVAGVTIGAVRHELVDGVLRSQIWEATDEGADRGLLATIRRMVRGETAPLFFHGVYRFTVQTSANGYLDLAPVNTSLGLPSLIPNVLAVVGLPGGVVDPTPGSTCLVAFVDGAPTDPVVLAYEGPAGSGWLPVTAGLNATTSVLLGQALGYALRNGDLVTIGGVQPGPGVTGVPLTLAPAVLVAPGAPGVGRSKVLE